MGGNAHPWTVTCGSAHLNASEWHLRHAQLASVSARGVCAACSESIAVIVGCFKLVGSSVVTILPPGHGRLIRGYMVRYWAFWVILLDLRACCWMVPHICCAATLRLLSSYPYVICFVLAVCLQLLLSLGIWRDRFWDGCEESAIHQETPGIVLLWWRPKLVVGLVPWIVVALLVTLVRDLGGCMDVSWTGRGSHSEIWWL